MDGQKDNNLEIRKVDDIISDFVSVLDEAIATYNVLEKIKDEDSRPNQLLFCHIINGFDSFVNYLLEFVVFSNNEILKEYLKKEKNFEEKPSLDDVINIHEKGVYTWMKEQASRIFEGDIRRKRHAQKLELLLKNLEIDYKNIFVFLTGVGKYASGCLRKKPTSKSHRRTQNHKTTPENIVGYADLLYEKRNAITHNNTNHPDKVICRLNKDWNIKIDRNYVIIRRSTIKSVIRFFTSIVLKIMELDFIKNSVDDLKLTEFKINLEDLKQIKNIRSIKLGIDDRFVCGGIDARKQILLDSGRKIVSIREYSKITGISSATSRRDINSFVDKGFMKKTKSGKYKSTSCFKGTRPE